MCTCGRCLAFSLNAITIPFVFKRVHMYSTSHQPVHMFLQACCTCMLSACDHKVHTARVHTHATCARWLENSPLTIACRASPMPGRCVHACLARLLLSSLSCIPAFSPNDERFSRSGFNFPLNITCNKLMHGISCMHQITMSYMASHALHGIPMYCMATEKCCCKSKGLSARDCGQ